MKGIYPFGWVGKVDKKKALLLSAMLVDNGLWKGDEIFLVLFVELKPNVMVEVPDCMAEASMQFDYVMSSKLTKKLSLGEI